MPTGAVNAEIDSAGCRPTEIKLTPASPPQLQVHGFTDRYIHIALYI